MPDSTAYGSCLHTTESAGIRDNRIPCLLESGDGSLWIGSHIGLVQFKGGRFINRTDQLRYPHVSAIGRIGNGVLVATGMRLSRFGDGRPASCQGLAPISRLQLSPGTAEEIAFPTRML